MCVLSNIEDLFMRMRNKKKYFAVKQNKQNIDQCSSKLFVVIFGTVIFWYITWTIRHLKSR